MNVLITGGQGDIAKAIRRKIESYCLVFDPGRDDLDVSSILSVQSYFERLKLKKQKIDILINNAGYIDPEMIKKSDPVKWIEHFNVNIIGPYLCLVVLNRTPM